MDLEGLPSYPKSLEGLRKAASGEQPFDVKDIFSASLESEALKETLYRQAKTQVCGIRDAKGEGREDERERIAKACSNIVRVQ